MMVSVTTCLVAGIHYLIHPQKLGTITATIKPDAILPVTLLTTEQIYSPHLEQILRDFDDADDVFVPEFGSVLVEKVSGNGTNSSSAAISQELYQLQPNVEIQSQLVDLPSGPYILHGPNLYQAWRLYEDSYEAFTFGVIPQNVSQPDQFGALDPLSASGVFKSIPVPSRLYYAKPSPKKPLSGIRVAITDAISLKGVRTTLSSRAWTSFYPITQKTTAEYARKLLDLGAVIVGKTKVSQFASGEEWVDAQAPWNPRADQYQDPSGSSAGAGAAVAGYDWLQHAVGEDAIGGLRAPAAHGGVYSLRPTFSNASLDGIQISSKKYDTVGLAGRTLEDLYSTANAVLGEKDSTEAPERIVYLNDLGDKLPQEQQDLLDGFVETLEKSLNTTAQQKSLGDIWSNNPPNDAGDQSLQAFMKEAPFRSYCYDYAREYQEFRDGYRSRFDHEPFVEAAPTLRWQLGRNVTEDEHVSDLKRIEVFQTWFRDNVMSGSSDTIVVLPYGPVTPGYRQDKPGAPTPVEGITPELLAPLLGAPNLVVPFAQVTYESKVSQRTEHLPVSASVLGPHGSDTAIINVVKEAFERAKWRTTVHTGRFTFPLGQSSADSNGRQIQARGTQAPEL